MLLNSPGRVDKFATERFTELGGVIDFFCAIGVCGVAIVVPKFAGISSRDFIAGVGILTGVAAEVMGIVVGVLALAFGDAATDVCDVVRVRAVRFTCVGGMPRLY